MRGVVFESPGCLRGVYHQRVLGNQLLPGQQEVHVAVHPKAVVHEVLLVGADEPPQLAALRPGRRERRGGEHGAGGLAVGARAV